MSDFQPDKGNRDHLREQWRLLALQWSELEDAASRLEEGRSIVISEEVLKLTEGGMSYAQAERKARVSDRFKKYVHAMHDARKAANDAKIEMQNADRLYWHHATDEANQRAEMRLSR